jgi:hypothetical protein
MLLLSKLFDRRGKKRRTVDKIAQLLCTSYNLPSIIKMVKQRRMGWEGHRARIGRTGTLINYWGESQKESDW